MTFTMRCCADCFDDTHLKQELIPSLSNEQGQCSYCGSNNVPLIQPIALREFFELVIGIYVQTQDGRTLAEWLKEDWSIFSAERMDVARSKALLADILDDGELVRKKFSPSSKSESDTLSQWNNLRTELMHSNRFFPKTDMRLDRLRRLLGFLLIKDDRVPESWFRARVQNTQTTYSPEEMFAPPKHLASHGRANPAGIPYLYLASNELTAISEVRPHTGEFVTVADVQIPTGQKIVDLRHPRRTISPFVLSDEDEISLLRGDISLLEKLGDELTRPVLPRAAAYDYIPSQYLCEFIKDCGFDGVMYKSSVGDGNNLALFNPSHARITVVRSRQVARVSVSVNE